MGELGNFIRQKRKEQGLRLEDLADEHISTATISNIERGVPHVNKEKVVYLMSKLELDLNEVPQMLLADNENKESMELKFVAIETLFYLGKYEQAWCILESLPSQLLTYHQAIIHSLKGKYYLDQKDWKKAERELSEAIRLAGQDRYTKEGNLIANCYELLASCRHLQNDTKHALLFIERGIQALQPNGENYARSKYRLLIHQVDYLEKSGRTNEALKRLNELWEIFDSIQDTSSILRMYVLQTKLLRRVKLYQDVIPYARKGIQLATNSRHYEEMFHLWMMLGMTYLDLYQLEDAKTCFSFVKELEEQVQDKREIIRAYCSLSYLYLLQDNFREAEKAAQQAVYLADKNSGKCMQHYVWILCGQIERKQSNLQKAIHYFKRAISIAEKDQHHLQASLQAHLELAACYQDLQEEELFIQTTAQIYHLEKEIKKDQTLSQWW